MDNNALITNLTVEELKMLIRQTVQETVAEVLLEFSLAAEYDAELVQQAEIAELLRSMLHSQHHNTTVDD